MILGDNGKGGSDDPRSAGGNNNNGAVRFHVICAVAVLLLCGANFGSFRPLQKQISSYLVSSYHSPGLQDEAAAASAAAEVATASADVVVPPPAEAAVAGDVSLPPTNASAAAAPGTPKAAAAAANGTTPPPARGPMSSSSSFCLLIKDDNDILPEWIAYHYHVMNMRRLIVAVDPDSETSPGDVLEKWGRTATAKAGGGTGYGGDGSDGLFDLDYTLWNDEDYMPEYFWREKDYNRVPNNLGKSVTVDPKTNLTMSEWHRGADFENTTQEEVKADLQRVNNHRFRQKTFVSQCYSKLKKENRTWTIHIDTDEYMVVNPLLRATGGPASKDGAGGNNKNSKKFPQIPKAPTAGSLLLFLEELYAKGSLPLTCLMMPTLRFGSREEVPRATTLTDGGHVAPAAAASASGRGNNNNHSSSLWRHESLETLRWEYHGNYTTNDRNGKAKSVVNVATIPDKHPIFRNGAAFSIHEPLVPRNGGAKHACKMGVRDLEPASERPLSINHYLGSLERFLSRGDVRRNAAVYRAKGTGTDTRRDDGWIKDWFGLFVDEHGVEKVLTVMGNHTTTTTTAAAAAVSSSSSAAAASL